MVKGTMIKLENKTPVINKPKPQKRTPSNTSSLWNAMQA